MNILEKGHIYELAYIDDDPMKCQNMAERQLVFVNREDNPHAGTQTQEVIRALIDRTMYCDNCLRWEGNDKIIYHLRMALVLHEARALERKVEKGAITAENIVVGADGHFNLQQQPRKRYEKV